MRKFLKAFLLLIVALLVVACSNDSGVGDNNKGENKGNDKGKDEKEDQITIKYYNWDNDVTEKSTEQYIKQFEDENPNIKVESVALVPGDSQATMENLDILLASGESIDVIKFPSAGAIYERASKGALLPLNEFYEDEGIDPEEEYFVNPNIDGKYYGMPYEAVTNIVLLNKDALDEAGLEVPKAGWTWEDYKDYAEKLTVEKDGKTRYGTYFHTWGMYINPPAQTLMRHAFLNEDYTTHYDDPSWKYFYQYRKELEEKGYAKPYVDVLGAELSYVSEYFNEEAAMLLTGTFMIPNVGDVEANPHDFKTAFAPAPVLNEGDEPKYFMGGGALAIGNNSEHKDAAYKFARFITTNLSEARIDLPGLKNADMKPLVERIIEGNEEYYDIDSLMYILTSDDISYLEPSAVVIDYGGELEEVAMDGFGKYMLNNEDIDEVIDWMVEKAEEVIEKRSK